MNKKSLLALSLGVSLAVGGLVSGTYTMVQASQRPAGMGLEEGRPERPEKHERHMFNKEAEQELLGLLQIDEQTFRQEKDSGKSLAQIGAAHNVGRQEIIDLVLKQMNQHLEQGVAEGRISEDRANEMREHASAKVQEMVDGKHMGFDKRHGDKKENQQELLNLLQVDEATFKQEMGSGKTLGQIADQHNISRQDIIDLMVKHMNQHIDKDVAEGRLTEQQASEMKNHAAEKTQEMIDHPMMKHHQRPER